MKQLLVLGMMVIGMITYAQETCKVDCIVEDLTNFSDYKVEKVNNVLFEDYSVTVNSIEKSNVYTSLKSCNADKSHYKYIKMWDNFTAMVILPKGCINEATLNSYLGNIAEQDGDIEHIDGYWRSWTGPWFTYELTKSNGELTLLCHRYYDHDWCSNGN